MGICEDTQESWQAHAEISSYFYNLLSTRVEDTVKNETVNLDKKDFFG